MRSESQTDPAAARRRSFRRKTPTPRAQTFKRFVGAPCSRQVELIGSRPSGSPASEVQSGRLRTRGVV